MRKVVRWQSNRMGANENVHWVHSENWDKSVYELCPKYDIVDPDGEIVVDGIYGEYNAPDEEEI